MKKTSENKNENITLLDSLIKIYKKECISLQDLRNKLKPYINERTPMEYDDEVSKAYNLFFSENYEEAFKLFSELVEKDVCKAYNGLGNFYCGENTLVKKDINKQIEYYSVAANKGFLPAIENYGFALWKKSLGKNMHHTDQHKIQREALKWITIAAEEGFYSSQNWLGYIYGDDRSSFTDYVKQAKWDKVIINSNVEKDKKYDSFLRLGINYERGYGAKKDVDLALSYLLEVEKATGNGECYLHLANCYFQKGNYDKAFKYYKKACATKTRESEYMEAEHMLGHLYLKGLGTEKNIKEAYEYLSKAVSGGRKKALKDFNDCSKLIKK